MVSHGTDEAAIRTGAAPHSTTSTSPHVTVIPQLRGPNLDVAKIAPRKPLPQQHAVRKPLSHDLDAWYAAAENAIGGKA